MFKQTMKFLKVE